MVLTIPNVGGEGDGGAAAPAPAPKPLQVPATRTDQSLLLAAQQDPNKAAEYVKVGQANGVPPDLVGAVDRSGDASAWHALRERARQDRAGLVATKRWLQSPLNASVAYDDLDSLAGIERALMGTRSQQSWFGDVGRAAAGGFQGLEASYWHLAAALGSEAPEAAAEGLAGVARAAAERGLSESMSTRRFRQDIAAAEGLGVIPTALSDPAGLAVLVAENLGFSAPSLALGGAGAAAAGQAGFAGGTFAGSMLTEFGAAVDKFLGEAGVDMTDPAQVLAAYRNPVLMGQIREKANRMALGISLVEMLSSFVGGAKVAQASKGGIKQTVVAGAKETLEQSVLEGVGQGFGDLLATGEVDVKEAALESVASLGHSVGQVAIGASLRGTLETVQRTAQAVQDTRAIREAVGVVQKSKLATRLPEALVGFVDGQLRGQDNETLAARFDRDAWDEAQRAAGLDPQAEAAKAVKDGAERYLRSDETGVLEIPMGSFLTYAAQVSDPEPLFRVGRWRPDGITLAEAEEAQATRAEVEKQATELFQTREKNQAKIAALDEEIATLAETDKPSGDLSTLSESESARLAEAIAERDALQAEIDQTAPQEDASEALRQRAEAELVAAGRSQQEAAVTAPFFVRAFEVLSERSGVPVEQLAQRFLVRFQKGDARGLKATDTLFQTAYHGTGAPPFDRFSLNYIGTGEGAQAYGWGLYFASKKSIAESYKKKLSKREYAVTVDGVEIDTSDVPPLINPSDNEYRLLSRFISESKLTLDELAKVLLAKVSSQLGYPPGSSENLTLQSLVRPISSRLASTIDRVNGGSFAVRERKSGSLLTVDLAPAEDEYLLWDRPLSEQSEKVKAALERHRKIAGYWRSDSGKWPSSVTGADLYRLLEDRGWVIDEFGRGQPGVSKALLAAGIPGIKYLDGSSRSAGEGSYNYVLFDDSLVKIVEYEQNAGDYALPDTIDVDGVQRPTTNSEGRPIAQIEQGIRNFWRWFGDSKVVDEQGRPRVVYHGTLAGQFDVFDKSRADNAHTKMLDVPTFFFAGHQDTSTTYGTAIVPAYLRIENPIIIDGAGREWWEVLSDEIRDKLDVYDSEEGRAFVRYRRLLDEKYAYVDDWRFEDPRTDAERAEIERLSREYERVLVGRQTSPGGFGTSHDGTIVSGVMDSGALPRDVASEEGVTSYYDTVFAVFDPEQIKSALGNSGEFDPANPSILRQGGKRGSTRFDPAAQGGPQRAFDVSFFSRADRSTFIHEMGHVFLEILGDLAADADAPAQIRDDFGAVLKWLGVESRDKIEVKHHEQFARGFEAYLREGKAPSKAMRSVFAAFRDWLVRLYKQAKTLNVTLSDEIRGVMDRLVATDVEIEAAQYEVGVPSLPADVLEGLTDEDRNRYASRVQDAEDEAKNALDVEADKILAAHLRALRGEAMDRLRARVAAAVDAQPGMKALNELKAEGGAKIGTTGLTDAQKAALEPLGVLAEGGEPLADVAEVYGFADVGDFIRALQTFAQRDALIERQARELLKLEHPELMGRTVARAQARKAVASEARSELLTEEAKALRRRAREDAARTRAAARTAAQTARAAQVAALTVEPVGALRERAAAYLAGLSLRMIRPSAFLAAAKRESNKVLARVKANDYLGAAKAKDRERYNHELYRIAVKMLEKADRNRRRILSMDEGKRAETLAKAGFTYAEQKDGILARFSFKRMSDRALRRSERHPGGYKPLSEWVTDNAEQRAADGDDRELYVPAYLLDDRFRVHWRDLTADQLQGIRDTLDGIYHLAKTKHELLQIRKDRTFQMVRDEAVAGIVASTGRRADADKIAAPTRRERLMQTLEDAYAWEAKLPAVARIMDDLQEGGPVIRAFVRPINDAQTAEGLRNMKEGEALKALYALIPDYGKRSFGDKSITLSTGEKISRQDAIGIALHWGNETGRERIVNGLGMSAADVRTAFAALTADDVKFINALYAYYDSFREEIGAKEKRVTGVEPTWLDPLAYDVPAGRITGGYHKIKYRGVHAHQLSVAEQARIMKRGAFASSQTRRGHVRDRAEHVDGKVRLDLGVITEHINEVVHDLTHHEMLLDVNRLLRDDVMKSAIVAHYGESVYRLFLSTIEDVAAGTTGAKTRTGQVVNALRANVSTAMLALKVQTGFLNMTGITQSWERVGFKWVNRGLSKWLRSNAGMEGSVEWVHGKSAFMRSRMVNFHDVVREMRDKLDGKKHAAWKDWGWVVIEKTQLAVDMPTWLGAYERAMEETGADDAESVARADQAVRDAQGSGQLHDLSKVQREPVAKLFTVFYFYLNTTFQRTVEAGVRFQRSESKMQATARLAADLMMLYFLPATMITLMGAAVRGYDDDDEFEPGRLAIRSLKEALGMALGTVVGVRELQGMIDGFDYKGPAALRIVPEISNLATQIRQGEMDAAFRRSLVNTVGLLVGAPASQINSTMDGIQSVTENEATGYHVLTAPIVGRPYPSSR